ncbi:VWA domain-containing protein [Haloferula rosea]|uniref:VWA domain-containing protein n=1 Tax=Haloferula rosea TaxID=490093 RepID=A0A934VGF0_9BACT|nr:VWA domain-containing protein [Haloferula rosea]MBK1828001.1 VWA domain-containing protein [Haloferula rosea]
MSGFETFHFLRPWWLLALPVMIVAWWHLRRLSDPLAGWRRSMDPELLEAMTLGRDSGSKIRSVLQLAAALLVGLALAGPVWRLEPSTFAGDPAPVMVLLRADESMSLDDLSPSRLERAQLKIHDFAAGREGGALGLLAYAGSAHLVLPPTEDAQVVATMAGHVSPEIMPKPGDDLAGAILRGKRALGERGGAMIVIADDAVALTSADLSRWSDGPRVPIHVLAVALDGSPELDAIRQVAGQLRASVTRISADGSDVLELLDKVAGARASVEGGDGATRWAEDGWYLLPLAALCMLPLFRREQQLSTTEGVT